MQKRLKNEPGICCVAITDDASRIAFGIANSNKYVVSSLLDPSKHSQSGFIWDSLAYEHLHLHSQNLVRPYLK